MKILLRIPRLKKAVLSSLICVLLLLIPAEGYSFRVLYREQLWQLYHLNLYNYPLDYAENIHWLEQALRADFANPLYALAKINDQREWEKYRNLFTMHINLKLVELYLHWGAKHNKFEGYFYNAPWRDQNLASLEKAETLFQYALIYWEEAKKYSDEAAKFRWLYLLDVQYWEDESYRIQNDELNYESIIQNHLRKLEEVRTVFLEMDGNTY